MGTFASDFLVSPNTARAWLSPIDMSLGAIRNNTGYTPGSREMLQSCRRYDRMGNNLQKAWKTSSTAKWDAPVRIRASTGRVSQEMLVRERCVDNRSCLSVEHRVCVQIRILRQYLAARWEMRLNLRGWQKLKASWSEQYSLAALSIISFNQLNKTSDPVRWTQFRKLRLPL